MWEKQSSNVEVLFSFSDNYTRPVRLTWEGENYDLGGVQFWYAEQRGGTLVHHYTVGDKAGTYTFQLALETENLTWKLEKAVAAPVSRLNVWSGSGLVGVMS